MVIGIAMIIKDNLYLLNSPLVVMMITMRGDRREEAAKKQTLTPLFSNTAPPQTFS